jgi:hypothetical protein
MFSILITILPCNNFVLAHDVGLRKNERIRGRTDKIRAAEEIFVRTEEDQVVCCYIIIHIPFSLLTCYLY